MAFRNHGVEEIVLHTGQHYDRELSAIFFEELELAPPAIQLDAGSGTHADQTARMLPGIERAVLDVEPAAVVVFGDTNSTLAGALAAAKLGTPVAHVEAGLRSWDRSMPEELNRIVVDHLASLLLAPSDTAVANLRREGIGEGVHQVGDVMYDANLALAPLARERSTALADAGVAPGAYALLTLHREANTRPSALERIVNAIGRLGEPVVFPVHPRTAGALAATTLELPE
ncbi:MAG: UDP-N-acetylglucosamine 2-epimerase, partial [Thermoleophilia bacterium]|nr:UDP-N-acetylglucosamine 2-epimerase [Thermoleophilia bacterium]